MLQDLTLMRFGRVAGFCLAVLAMVAGPNTAVAAEASRFLAPGFTSLEKNANVVIMPVDVELFELSAGGVAEPKADWTSSAQQHMKSELARKTKMLGLTGGHVLPDSEADEFAEEIGLQAAVARSINLHHAIGGMWALPSKNGQLDWNLGDAMKGIQTKTQARYGLFVWVRDSYASAARKATMVAMALFGVGLTGGSQVGYASLVDLQTGQVLWFNRLARGSGDLRESAAAAETIDILLTSFPAGK